MLDRKIYESRWIYVHYVDRSHSTFCWLHAIHRYLFMALQFVVCKIIAIHPSPSLSLSLCLYCNIMAVMRSFLLLHLASTISRALSYALHSTPLHFEEIFRMFFIPPPRVSEREREETKREEISLEIDLCVMSD
jgi:hypothetical protein